MSSSYDIIKRMRGETSDPLVQELASLIGEGREKNHNALIVQVKSELVVRGLTLILSLDTQPNAWIFLARKEVPGFLPPSVLRLLMQANWVVVADAFGQEFSAISKTLAVSKPIELASDLVLGLEALGTPQMLHWELPFEFR
jgi:hypothetical protein